jgi:hypothetical protein
VLVIVPRISAWTVGPLVNAEDACWLGVSCKEVFAELPGKALKSLLLPVASKKLWKGTWISELTSR